MQNGSYSATRQMNLRAMEIFTFHNLAEKKNKLESSVFKGMLKYYLAFSLLGFQPNEVGQSKRVQCPFDTQGENGKK